MGLTEEYEESSIEKSKPAATVAGSSFSAGSSKQETVHTSIDIGDSSATTSMRHEASQRQGHYSGNVLIDAKKAGGYAVVPAANNDGIGTATITHTSRYNTTFVNGQPVGRTYQNTTIVRGTDGRVIDTQTRYSQTDLAQGEETANVGAVITEPYPRRLPTSDSSDHFNWDNREEQQSESWRRHQQQQQQQSAYGSRQAAGGARWSEGDAEAETRRQQGSYARRGGWSQYNQSQEEYYDRYGQAAGSQYDREYHTRGQDLRGYGGDATRYSQEQSAGANQYHRQQGVFEDAAAGNQFRTHVVDLGKLGRC